MAQRMAHEGAEVLLAAKLSEDTRKSLHSNLKGDILHSYALHMIQRTLHHFSCFKFDLL